jgi:hypothetical protein
MPARSAARMKASFAEWRIRRYEQV